MSSSFRFAIRAVAGFLVAPLAAAVASFLLYFVPWFFGAPVIGPADGPPLLAVGLAIGSVFVAVPVTLLGGVPLFIWKMKRGTLSLGTALRSGAALGVSWYFLLVAAIPLIRLANGSMAGDAHRMWSAFDGFRFLIFVLFIATVGMAAAAMFWMVAVRGTDLDPTRSG